MPDTDELARANKRLSALYDELTDTSLAQQQRIAALEAEVAQAREEGARAMQEAAWRVVTLYRFGADAPFSEMINATAGLICDKVLSLDAAAIARPR